MVKKKKKKKLHCHNMLPKQPKIKIYLPRYDPGRASHSVPCNFTCLLMSFCDPDIHTNLIVNAYSFQEWMTSVMNWLLCRISLLPGLDPCRLNCFPVDVKLTANLPAEGLIYFGAQILCKKIISSPFKHKVSFCSRMAQGNFCVCVCFSRQLSLYHFWQHLQWEFQRL